MCVLKTLQQKIYKLQKNVIRFCALFVFFFFFCWIQVMNNMFKLKINKHHKVCVKNKI